MTKIYLDTGDIREIEKYFDCVDGFTTNPALIENKRPNSYFNHCQKMVEMAGGKSISFALIDTVGELALSQAEELANLGNNISVKIAESSTYGQSNASLISALSLRGIPLNITAIFDIEQFNRALHAVNDEAETIFSFFCGRVADTGTDPGKLISSAVKLTNGTPHKILWASTRQLFNVIEAKNSLCDIITIPSQLLENISRLDSTIPKLANEVLLDFSRATNKLNW